MNGLQASSKISELSNKIATIERVIMNLASNHDFSYERRILKEMRDEMKKEKSILEDKLRSIQL